MTARAYDPHTMERKLLSVADAWEERFGRAARDAFGQDRDFVLALVNENQREALRRKAMPNWVILKKEIADYFKDASEETWRDIFAPLIEGVIQETGSEWATTLGVQFNVRNLQGEAWFQEYVLKFAQPISDTSSATVQDVIAQGLAEGWSSDQLKDKLGLVFEQWMAGDLSPEDFDWFTARMPDYRREMIARTEAIRASNAGTYQMGTEWGMREKQWLTQLDGRERDSHRDANLQRRPINEPFTVGASQMMYPHDGSLGAGPEEIVNCRCTILLHR